MRTTLLKQKEKDYLWIFTQSWGSSSKFAQPIEGLPAFTLNSSHPYKKVNYTFDTNYPSNQIIFNVTLHCVKQSNNGLPFYKSGTLGIGDFMILHQD